VEDAGTFERIGKGASIGATVGTAIPVPGVGTAVGSVAGAVGGLASSLFGSDPPEAKIRGVIPILLKKALEKKGATVVHDWPDTDFKYGAKGGVRIKGKAFKPQDIYELAKELLVLASQDAESQKVAKARKYARKYMDVGPEKPSNPDRIIASFKKPRPTPEVTANSTAAKNGTSSVLYLLGAGIPLAYFLTR